jgi:hypothetical protein
VGLAVLVGSAVPAAASSPEWTVVASADPSAQTNDKLLAIAAVSGANVWAVGSSDTSSIVEHWNGTAWSLSKHPNSGTNGLDAVAATSASDVWAVGETFDANANSQPLTEHFNGASWSVVSAPAVSSNDELLGVAALSPTNAWAVGTSNFKTTLIEHWNGSAWTVVSGPSLPNAHSAMLSAVAIANANDIWAVGSESLPAGDGFCNTTLAEHWDGTSWSVVATPTFSTTCPVLNAVAIAAAGDVWAVGRNAGIPLAEHWNGTSWTVASTSGVSTNANLNGVTVVNPDDVWAVGEGDFSGSGNTLTMHWDGTTWTAVDSPSGSQAGVVFGVAQVPGTSTLWAAGQQINDPRTFLGRTLVLRDANG